APVRENFPDTHKWEVISMPATATSPAPARGNPVVSPQLALTQTSLPRLAQHMYALMLRNVATDGFAFEDPANPGTFSVPGCVIAAPSFPANTPGVDQDYVFNWTRDAAITAIEIASASYPGATVQALNDYVTFAQLSQQNAIKAGLPIRAASTINGQPRQGWTDQSDGPALQNIAILKAFPLLDSDVQSIARSVINTNMDILMNVYQDETFNLWEEHKGFSFFARSVQLLCFQVIKVNTIGIPVPAGTDNAIAQLTSALQSHWDGAKYVSIMPAPQGYDPNIDIISASLYGAVVVTDPQLLATAALLRSQWADDNSPYQYPINVSDRARQMGPLLGRYPGDTYDGDMADQIAGDHPWALCTCNLAELYYRVASAISATGTVPADELSRPFFAQIGVSPSATVQDAINALHAAGDSMLNAVIFHSDHLELSEQFDGVTGYEKSVRNLTWSYAAFISAVRAKANTTVNG
ncbi:MAG TPA: glycoside hydrolase family 15 protein, partial [Bryobacteraceae bacterium]|nr:glycoside hydrolase family 15 protein [Bryobacteraceae bacterium]